MKNLMTILICFLSAIAVAQNPKMAVISFDANDEALNQQELTELLRIEIAKHNKYEMIDRYEIAEMLNASDILASECYSKSCLSKAGEVLGVNYSLSGSADKLGEALFIRLRLVNIKTKTIEEEVVREFLYIPEKINTMISICVNQLLDIPNDQTIINSLSNRESYESAINNPYYQTLKLNGPRMGYTFFTGDVARTMKKPKDQGGYDAWPAFFQMGYQFEKQYLNEGQWQALFEFIPMVSGVDQGYLIPSLTVLNGIRSNKNGLEFAIGPSLNVVRESRHYLYNNEWIAGEDLPVAAINEIDALQTDNRMDSRGSITAKTYVVLAAGYSIRSGKLNIPINAFVIPSKDNLRFGFSFGFNSRK